MTGNTHQLFVYGTLRSDGPPNAHALLQPYFTLLNKATVQGRLYDLGNYPGAVTTLEEVFITGELYGLRRGADAGEAFRVLDEYEETTPVGNGPALFRRGQVTVFVNGAPTPAWIYWYNNTIAGKPCILCGDWLQYRQQKS